MCAGPAGVYCDNESVSSDMIDLMSQLTSGTVGVIGVGAARFGLGNVSASTAETSALYNSVREANVGAQMRRAGCIGVLVGCGAGASPYNNSGKLINGAHGTGRQVEKIQEIGRQIDLDNLINTTRTNLRQ